MECGDISSYGGNGLMKLLILCDKDSKDYKGIDFCQQVRKSAESKKYDVDVVILDSDEIKPCVGCFGCWTKTPGNCVIKTDSGNSNASKFIHADVVLLLSRVTYGGYSPDVKAFLDRNIPNFLPFFKIVEGEMHHQKRYKHYPDWIAFGYGDMTNEEKETFLALEKRNVLNFHPKRNLALTAQNEVETKSALAVLEKFLEEGVLA